MRVDRGLTPAAPRHPLFPLPYPFRYTGITVFLAVYICSLLMIPIPQTGIKTVSKVSYMYYSTNLKVNGKIQAFICIQTVIIPAISQLNRRKARRKKAIKLC